MIAKTVSRSGRVFTRAWVLILTMLIFGALILPAAAAQVPEPVQTAVSHEGGGEASLVLPDLSQVDFHGYNARTLLSVGLGVCILGLLFGLVIFMQLKNLPVHKAMREISELIYETCKTYLITQGKFILILEVFIGIIMLIYFGFLQHFAAGKVAIILIFSLIGIGGSYGVAWFGSQCRIPAQRGWIIGPQASLP